MEQSGTSALGVSPLWEICRDVARADRVVRPYGINAEPCLDAARGDVGIAPYESPAAVFRVLRKKRDAIGVSFLLLMVADPLPFLAVLVQQGEILDIRRL